MDDYFLKSDPKKAAAKLDADLETYKAAAKAAKEGGEEGAAAAAEPVAVATAEA